MTKPTEIDQILWQKLIKASEKMNACNQLIQQFQREMENRLTVLNKETREIWMEIAKKHNIDLQNVDWAPDQDKPFIIPLAVRFNFSSIPDKEKPVN